MPRPEFSKCSGSIKESFIMGLVEVASKPGMISFATGLPDNNLLDPCALRDAMADVLDNDGPAALQYGPTSGYYGLKERVAERCRRVLGVDAQAEDVFFTNGSQECFDQLGRMFLNRGDIMAVENPGYLGAIQSFTAYGPCLHGVDVDEHGPDMAMLESSVEDGAKLFYSIPNFQNPTGASYSESARREVASIIDGSSCLMIEDDAYGELSYDGSRRTVMKSLADDTTVLTGSFSKTISPGMRVGWMVVPEWMREHVNRSMEAASLQSNTFCQRVIDRFLEMNDYDRYLSHVRRGYREKRDIFMDAMDDLLPDTVTWNVPEGGMFVWLRTPPGTRAMRLHELCLERGLVIMPGEPFHTHGGENAIRLNFATPDEDAILKGMHILGDVCRDLYGA